MGSLAFNLQDIIKVDSVAQTNTGKDLGSMFIITLNLGLIPGQTKESVNEDPKSETGKQKGPLRDL